AVPLELVPGPTMKITKAFAAIGLHGVSVDSSASDPTRMRAALLPTPERASEVSERVRHAAATLEGIQHEIRDAVRRARA
ncbi:hypothetical protein, partial [uncultured Microbacterium sp.]|uniref:hypothetical protein n=1 Tax=uncultured Microbacterium sp. TaxID=191216 RepID=UPI0025D5F2DA